MNTLLQQTQHRPFPLPKGKWAYYQEWNNALFLHWEVSYEALRELVPEKLEIDMFQGKAYVSLVAFTMQKIRPRYLPAIRAVSDFDEINIRTYVTHKNKPGVYFLNMEAGKRLSAQVAKALSGLPYEKAEMFRKKGAYLSSNTHKNYLFQAEYKIEERNQPKTVLDRWLTERYSLYLYKNKQYYRYDIHHLEWEIKALRLINPEVNYQIGDLKLKEKPDIVHYSKGVKVLAWPREKYNFKMGPSFAGGCLSTWIVDCS